MGFNLSGPAAICGFRPFISFSMPSTEACLVFTIRTRPEWKAHTKTTEVLHGPLYRRLEANWVLGADHRVKLLIKA